MDFISLCCALALLKELGGIWRRIMIYCKVYFLDFLGTFLASVHISFCHFDVLWQQHRRRRPNSFHG
jgi:hypothetical protein